MTAVNAPDYAQKDPWRIDQQEFPAQGRAADKLKFFLRYAVLAPSLYNAQPWLYRVRGNELDMFADRSRALAEADSQGRQLVISCGAALFNLRVAARCFLCKLAVETFPDSANPDWLARATLAGDALPSEEDRLLLRSIPKRRTHHKQFGAGMPSPSLLARLRDAVATHGVELTYAQHSELKASVAELAADAEQELMADPAFVAERENWLRPEHSDSRDGVPRSYLRDFTELPDFAAPEWSQAMGTPDTPAFHADYSRRLAERSPLLALLSTPENSPPWWLRAGEAMEHAVLLGRNAGLWAAYLNQPIQITALRSKLRRLMGASGHPQMLVRLGHGREPPRTARRCVEEVLLRE